MNTLTEALSKLANVGEKPQEEKVVLTEGQKELKESLERKLGQVNKNNCKNSFELSKVYEKAIQEGINNLYPDAHWSQITKANIMATLLENKNDVNKTVDKIVNESTLNELFGLGKYVLKYGKTNSQIFIGSQKDCQQQLNTLKDLLRKPEYADQKYILNGVSIEKWKGGNKADEGGVKAFLSKMKKYRDDSNAKEQERKNREEEAKLAAERERAARNKKKDDDAYDWGNKTRHISKTSSGHYNRDGSWQYESRKESKKGKSLTEADLLRNLMSSIQTDIAHGMSADEAIDKWVDTFGIAKGGKIYNAIREQFKEPEDYEITVGFAGMIGCEETYTIYAKNRAQAAHEAIEEASYDLDVEDIEETDDENEWEVTVNFCGYIGCEETYDIYAEDEDEAREEGLQMAKDDLNIIDINGEPFDWNDIDESLNESKSLDEDTPEDLRKAITRDSYADNSYRSYGKGLRGSNRYFQAREYGNNVDFAASDAQEVDPKDALKALKAGEDMSKYFLMMNNGQTVQLDKWGHPERSPYAVTSGGNNERENASLKTMLGKAAKVYKYDYKLAKDTHPERFADRQERKANLRRGSMSWDVGEYDGEKEAQKYHQYLQYKGDKSAIDAARKAYEDGDISRKEMERRIERAQDNGPSDWERRDAKDAYNKKRNMKAADTYYASNKKLQEPIKRLGNLRWQLRDAQRDLNYTQGQLAQARSSGDSYYVKKAEEVRQQIASLQRSLKYYEDEIAKSQSTATIADYEKQEAQYQAQMNQIQADLDALLRRSKTESFRKGKKKALKESVKVDQHFVLQVDSEEEVEKTVAALKKKGFACEWHTEPGESGAYIEVFGGDGSEEVTNAILKELGLNESVKLEGKATPKNESLELAQKFTIYGNSREEISAAAKQLKDAGIGFGSYDPDEGFIEGEDLSPEEYAKAMQVVKGIIAPNNESLDEAKDLDKRKGSFANEIQSNKEVKAEFEQAANLGKAKGLEHMLKAIEKANISDDTKKKLSAKVRGTSAAGWLSMLGTMSTGEKVIK